MLWTKSQQIIHALNFNLPFLTHSEQPRAIAVGIDLFPGVHCKMIWLLRFVLSVYRTQGAGLVS